MVSELAGIFTRAAMMITKATLMAIMKAMPMAVAVTATIMAAEMVATSAILNPKPTAA